LHVHSEFHNSWTLLVITVFYIRGQLHVAIYVNGKQIDIKTKAQRQRQGSRDVLTPNIVYLEIFMKRRIWNL